MSLVWVGHITQQWLGRNIHVHVFVSSKVVILLPTPSSLSQRVMPLTTAGGTGDIIYQYENLVPSNQPVIITLAEPEPSSQSYHQQGPRGMAYQQILGNAFDRAGQMMTLLKATLLSHASHGPWLGLMSYIIISQSKHHQLNSIWTSCDYFQCFVRTYTSKWFHIQKF